MPKDKLVARVPDSFMAVLVVNSVLYYYTWNTSGWCWRDLWL